MSSKAYLCPNMINSNAVDFSERYSKEVSLHEESFMFEQYLSTVCFHG